MFGYRSWAAKQAGKPKYLVIAFFGFTFSFYGMYKYAYVPWKKRKQLKEAETYSNYIFELEQKKRS